MRVVLHCHQLLPTLRPAPRVPLSVVTMASTKLPGTQQVIDIKWTTGDVAELCRMPFWASKQFLKSVLTQLFDVAEHKFERLWQRLTLDENVAMT